MVVDTTVISEMMKPAAARSQAVVAWLQHRPLRTLYTTALTVAEIFGGIEVLPEGQRKEGLRAAAERVFAEGFPGRILPFDDSAGRAYGSMIARHRRAEIIASPIDRQIAAIAKARGMAVVTRDRDFERFDVVLVNPWEVA
jgi:predicted nucleic acid-binding protein